MKEAAAETHSFQAEVAELLRLMVHSVYTETDIFLRELISNASDACDRLRYEAIASPELTAGDAPFVIRITPDKDKSTLTIADNGIGMTTGRSLSIISAPSHAPAPALSWTSLRRRKMVQA